MSIGMLLEMAATGHPDRRVVDQTTFVELAGLAERGAEVIRAAQARHVVYLGVNAAVWPVVLFASASAGVPVTPLNYRLSGGQLRDLVASLPDPLVIADERYLPQVPGAVPSQGWPAGATTAPATRPRVTSAVREVWPAAPSDPDPAAVVLFTSGTTARPKGVVLRHSHLVGYVLQTVEFASAEEHETALVSVPPYHVAGVGTVLTNVYAGRRMVHLPDFTARSWLDLVRAEQVSQAMVVPTMLARLVDHLDGQPADLPRLRALAYGGARMPVNVLERALEAFPEAGFTNAYGLTETSSTIAVLSPQDHRDALASDNPDVRARLGSAGRLVPGVEGEVRDGELWVRGPQVSGEYLGTGSVLDDDGWFPTRDRARFDADGYLFVDGRSDDTIIRGGENVAPAEIEDVLVRHPQLAEVAVVGVPDDEWGQRITAVVVPRRGQQVDPGQVRTWVRERLRGSRTPDEVVVRGELPYTPTGKLLRRDLVAALTAAPGQG